jgi:hypothetical protein
MKVPKVKLCNEECLVSAEQGKAIFGKAIFCKAVSTAHAISKEGGH